MFLHFSRLVQLQVELEKLSKNELSSLLGSESQDNSQYLYNVVYNLYSVYDYYYSNQSNLAKYEELFKMALIRD